MFKDLKSKKEGFTIIEVLIVLAIAGLILLIVFLAVPALQRNSRNTQIRNSAAAVLGGINDYVSNNNGILPASGSCTISGNTVTIGASGTNQAEAKVQGGYTVSCSGPAAPTFPTTAGNIVVWLGGKCNTTGNGFSSSGTARAYAAGFLIEANSGPAVAQCVES